MMLLTSSVELILGMKNVDALIAIASSCMMMSLLASVNVSCQTRVRGEYTWG